MTEKTNDHFNKFTPEKDLQESILVENPFPLNLHPSRKMDKFLRDLIFEKRAGSLEVAADPNLVKLQQLLDVMVTLSKVWTIVENARNSRFEQVEVSLPEILTNIDQAVMLLGQAFNNILYTRCFNALRQVTGDRRKTKQLFKVKKKMRYLLKKHNFYLLKDLSLILLKLSKTNKNLRKFSRQWQTNNSPYRDINKIMVGGRISRRCSPKITHHNIHGNQASSNTKINIDYSAKDIEVKLCHSKLVPLNKTSLGYPHCFNVSRVHPYVRALFPTTPIPEVPLAGRLKFFYSNWAKITQDLNILNIVQKIEIPFLQNHVQGKSPNPPVLNHEQSKLVKEEIKEMLLKGAIQLVLPCNNQCLSNFFLVSKSNGGNRPVINLKQLTNFIP